MADLGSNLSDWGDQQATPGGCQGCYIVCLLVANDCYACMAGAGVNSMLQNCTGVQQPALTALHCLALTRRSVAVGAAAA